MKWTLTLLTLGLFGLTLTTCEPPTKSDDDDNGITSHNFNWNVDTIGRSGSWINDVYIVNENSIWIVGDFGNSNDPSGFWNLAHWNGEFWVMESILDGEVGELKTISYDEVNEVLYFQVGTTTIKMTADSSKTKYEEALGSYNDRRVKKSILHKNNIYFGGTGGLFGVFNTSTNRGHTLNIPTTLKIQDFITVGDSIYIVASNWISNPLSELFIYSISDNKFSKMAQTGLFGSLISLWKDDKNNDLLISSGFGIFKRPLKGDSVWTKFEYQTNGYAIIDIEGNSNNLFFGGGFGFLSHYNGDTYQQLLIPDVPFPSDGNIDRIAFRDNVVAIIHNNGKKPIVLIGIQQ